MRGVKGSSPLSPTNPSPVRHAVRIHAKNSIKSHIEAEPVFVFLTFFTSIIDVQKVMCYSSPASHQKISQIKEAKE